MDVLQENAFLYLWQNRMLDYEKQKLPRKIDSIRYSLSQLDYLNQFSSNFKENWSLESRKFEMANTYSGLVDQKSKANNYAEAILSLNKGFKNDSKKWKSNVKASDLFESIRNKENNDLEYNKEVAKLGILLQGTKKRDLKRYKKVKCNQMNLDDPSPNFDIFSSIDLFEEEPSSLQRMVPSKQHQVPGDSFTGPMRSSFFQINGSSSFGPKSMRTPQPSHSSEFSSSAHPQNSRKNEMKRERFSEQKKYPWQQLKTEDPNKFSSFRTASHQLEIESQKKNGGRENVRDLYGNSKRSLGARGIKSKFVPPIRKEEESAFGGPASKDSAAESSSQYGELLADERLKNIDAKMVELIMNEIMDHGSPVTWDDIAGLDLAKSTIQEIVVWPMLRPDIFTGLRGPPKGILLFGPPGTGKTMIGKCIASQSQSTFFSISASSLTSKWVGEGEKMVRAMFAVAKCHQPAVIFIDEIDSLLTQRSDTEHESSRRLKTEFLVQLDGATSCEDERILVVGATNRPQELDEAARRRLVKRLYIPLPEVKAREKIVRNLLNGQSHSLSEEDVKEIGLKTEGYSGADMANLCREAALGPIRSLNFSDIQRIAVEQVRAISVEDFLSALRAIRASVSDQDLDLYEDWNRKYGINARI